MRRRPWQMQGVDPEPPSGTDGVVACDSAQIERAESEPAVRSGNSVQSRPKAIKEVGAFSGSISTGRTASEVSSF